MAKNNCHYLAPAIKMFVATLFIAFGFWATMVPVYLLIIAAICIEGGMHDKE